MNRGQDNVTNINNGSCVRRIIFKRQDSVVKITDRFDMTLVADWDVKEIKRQWLGTGTIEFHTLH